LFSRAMKTNNLGSEFTQRKILLIVICVLIRNVMRVSEKWLLLCNAFNYPPCIHVNSRFIFLLFCTIYFRFFYLKQDIFLLFYY